MSKITMTLGELQKHGIVPTAEEFFGGEPPSPTITDLDVAHYVLLRKENELEWQQEKRRIVPFINNIADLVKTQTDEKVLVEHRYPEFHECGDCGGYGPHFFAVRLRPSNIAMTRLGKILRRRSVLLIAVDEHKLGDPNKWVKIAVSRFLKKNLRNHILNYALAHLKKHAGVPQDNFRSQIGFGYNFGMINWCVRSTRLLKR